MKPAHLHYLAVGLAALCAILGLVLLIIGSSARSLQGDLRKLQSSYEAQQERINAALTIRQQVIPNLFSDLAKHSDDVSLKALVAKHTAPTLPEK